MSGRRTSALGAWLALGVLTACSPDGSNAGAQQQGPRRVVVLAPAAAEMLDALGLADRVVGLGQFGPWPASLESRPLVGGYDDPNVERVLELECDLLITAASQAAAPAHARLEALGVPVLALDTATYDGVFVSLARIGEAFGVGRQAQELERRMRSRIAELSRRAAELPQRSVLFVVGRDPLYVAGPGSHLDELIRRVGGRNVAHDAIAPYQQVSMETVLERLPEVIVDTSDNRPGGLGRAHAYWDSWEFLPAVREGRVYAVDPGRLVIPGMRLVEMTELMARLIHPETFGQPRPAGGETP